MYMYMCMYMYATHMSLNSMHGAVHINREDSLSLSVCAIVFPRVYSE